MRIRSLRFKISAAIFFTSVLIAVIYGVILYPFETRRYEAYVRKVYLLVDTVFQQKKDDLANELFARQQKALAASLDELGKVEGIVAVTVYLPDGKVFASTDLTLVNRLSENERQLLAAYPSIFVTEYQVHQNRSLGVYSREIEAIGMPIGFIRFHYDFAELRRETRSSIIIFVTLLVTTLVLMSGLLNFLLSRSVIKPVRLLRAAIHKLREGRLGETVAFTSTDEIGDVASAFNDMSVALQQSRIALQQAEEKYRDIFENAVEGIFQSTPGQGRFLTVNPSMVKLLGYTSQEELLTAVTGISRHLYVNPKDHEEFERRLREQDRVVGFECQLHRQNGTPIWVSASARGVRDGNGSLLYYEGSLVDITERREKKKAEVEKEAAEAASKAKSEFLAKVSHEIRTPMNAILGFTDLLISAVTEPHHKDFLQSIRTSGKSLMSLINDILDLSKIEAGKLELRSEPVCLRSIFAEIKRVFSLQVQEKGLAFQLEIAPDVPESLLLDEVRLRQVLFNLVGNAVKFTDTGRIEVSARREPMIDGPGFPLLIVVADTGIGIPPDAQEVVFESFRQQLGQSAKLYGGTGLGLTISKSLVEMMGGRITLQSQPAEGSLFTIHLPNLAVVPMAVPLRPRALVSIAPTGFGDASSRTVAQTGLPEPSRKISGPSAPEMNPLDGTASVPVPSTEDGPPLSMAQHREMIRLLENELTRIWESARRRQRIADIEEFGNRLQTLGNLYAVRRLSTFAEDLLFYVGGFDIDHIQKTLDAFPALIADLKRTQPHEHPT